MAGLDKKMQNYSQECALIFQKGTYVGNYCSPPPYMS